MMSEKWCNLVIIIAVIYIIFHWFHVVSLTFQNAVIAVVLLAEGIAILLYKNISAAGRQCLYRPSVSSGFFTVLLVPMALMGEIISGRKHLDSAFRMKEIWLSLAAVFAAITRSVLVDSLKFGHFLVILSMGAVLTLMYGWIAALAVFTIFVMWKGLELGPQYLPKSFTFGELALVLQFITGGVNRLILALSQMPAAVNEEFHLLLFVCTLIIAIALATVLVYVTASYSSLWSFIAVYTILAIVSLAFLNSTLGENPVLWLLSFLSGSCIKLSLLVAWIVLLAVTVVWTVVQSLQNDMITRSASDAQGHINHSTEITTPAHEEHLRNANAKSKSITFTTRKVFHVFILFVYIPGLMLDIHLLLLASTVVFGLFIILEAARALHVPVIGEPLDGVLRSFVDDRDQGLVFLTHIYLLVGMSLPLWISYNLFSSPKATLEMYSGVLALGVGDTVACVAGRAWGRIHWPGRKKTIEGTLCSVASQMMLVILGTLSDAVSVQSWHTLFAGVGLSALVEALTDQIDNLVLPLVLYPFLCIS